MGKVLVLVVVLVVLGGAWWFTSRDGSSESVIVPPGSDGYGRGDEGNGVMPVADDVMVPEGPIGSQESAMMKTYTLEEVAAHADRSSCWTAVRGNVYDLTGSIDTHPGGPEKMMQLCGKDGTEMFEKQHGGMEKQEAGLAKTQIGVLAK